MLTLAALATAAPAQAAERRFTVTDFDRVQVDGPFQVTLATGKPGSARAKGSNAALDRVSVTVEGRTLKIRPNRSAWGGYPGAVQESASLAVTTHGLRAVTVTGSGSIVIDKAKAMRFEAALSGTGALSIGRIEADMLAVSLIGSGRVTLGGKAKTLRATIQGAGDLDASAFAADDAEVNTNSAGKVTIGVKRAARVTAGGPGEIRITGGAACTLKGPNAGNVICGK